MSEKQSKKTKPSSRPTTGTRVAGGSPMSVELLERIVKLMSANDLHVVDVRDGEKRVILKRGAPRPATPVYAHPPAGALAVPATTAQPSGAESGAAPASEEAGLVPIKSPMVGTFYSATSPDAKPLVSVGTTVDEETDVCIIEAMKVFNSIKAETRGTIARVLVGNGQTVEFGQVLFLVKP